jgi:hypothetical protein
MRRGEWSEGEIGQGGTEGRVKEFRRETQEPTRKSGGWGARRIKQTQDKAPASEAGPRETQEPT